VAALSIEKAMLHRQLLDKDHLEDQLRTAREVQARLLPQMPPVIPGYELAGVSLPTYDIGGDYYDYLPLDQHRFGFVVADVAGDGVPAALVMSAFRALLRTNARREPDPARLAGTLNRLLPEFSGSGDFVTAFYGVLEPASGRLLYANCGHNPPLLIHTNGHAERLELHGPALGIFSSSQFELGEALLAEGDLLVLYTDGVVELINPDGELFGLSRLEHAVCTSCQDPAQTILEDIIANTQAFSGSNLYRDDFTLVILRRILTQAAS
jgi:serine phosphatase RsbU (regulator of sigma subunit)